MTGARVNSFSLSQTPSGIITGNVSWDAKNRTQYKTGSRGGNGTVRRLKFEEEMTAAILSGSRKVAPFGLSGGANGLAGQTTVIRSSKEKYVLSSTDQCEMRPGDRIIIKTPGGGGFGKKLT